MGSYNSDPLKALPFLFRTGPFTDIAEIENISSAYISMIMTGLVQRGYVKGPYVPFLPAMGLTLGITRGRVERERTLASLKVGFNEMVSLHIVRRGERSRIIDKLIYRVSLQSGKVKISMVEIDLKPHSPPDMDDKDFEVVRVVSEKGKPDKHTLDGKRIPSYKQRVARLHREGVIQKMWIPVFVDRPIVIVEHDSEDLPDPNPMCLTLVTEDGAVSFLEKVPEGYDPIPAVMIGPLSFNLSFEGWKSLRVDT